MSHIEKIENSEIEYKPYYERSDSEILFTEIINKINELIDFINSLKESK